MENYIKQFLDAARSHLLEAVACPNHAFVRVAAKCAD